MTMAILFRDMMPEEVHFPARPAPINFAYRERVDLRDMRNPYDPKERHEHFERLKHHAADKLAQHIAAHCKWFDMPDPIAGGDLVLQLELTISDRGAYENWLPHERGAGKREGYATAMKQAAESLPYGLADAATEFY